jgi:hypothetical protein
MAIDVAKARSLSAAPPWEGPFADPTQRLPQHPVGGAERAAARKWYRERKREREAARLAAERRSETDLPASMRGRWRIPWHAMLHSDPGREINYRLKPSLVRSAFETAPVPARSRLTAAVGQFRTPALQKKDQGAPSSITSNGPDGKLRFSADTAL